MSAHLSQVTSFEESHASGFADSEFDGHVVGNWSKQLNDKIRTTPKLERSIAQENAGLLKRRHAIAVKMSSWTPALEREFPKQQFLFEVLSVLTEAAVADMANCPIALFRVTMPVTTDFLFEKPRASEFGDAGVKESWQLLLNRQSNFKDSDLEAARVHDMSVKQGRQLSKYTPSELYYLALDPAVAVIPAVADHYFAATAFAQQLSVEHRHLLAAANLCIH